MQYQSKYNSRVVHRSRRRDYSLFVSNKRSFRHKTATLLPTNMNLLFATLLLCMSTMTTVTCFPSNITGTWYQVLTSDYLEQTVMLDWKCIKAHVSPSATGAPTPGQSEYNLYTSARIHDDIIGVTVSSPTVDMWTRAGAPASGGNATDGTAPGTPDRMYIQSSMINLISSVRTFNVRTISNNTLVISSLTDEALVVWTRNVKDYQKADKVPTEKYIGKIGFDVVDTYEQSCT